MMLSVFQRANKGELNDLRLSEIPQKTIKGKLKGTLETFVDTKNLFTNLLLINFKRSSLDYEIIKILK